MTIRKIKSKVFTIFLIMLVLTSMLFFLPSISHNSGNGNKKLVTDFLGESATFKESGLPSNTSWKITVDGSSFTSTTDEITARVGTSGSYSVTWSSENYFGGTETVPFPDSSVIGVVFSPGNNLSFTEIGLPSGTSWSVIFNGNTYTTMHGSQNIGIVETGYYNISWSSNSYLGGKQEIDLNAGSSNLTVGFAVVLHLPFKPFYFNISESGLPSGTSWNVTINGISYSSSGNAILIPQYEGEKQYSFSFYSHGYSSNPLSLVLSGGYNQSIRITFSPYYIVNFIFSSNPGFIIVNTNLGNFNVTGTTLSLFVPQGFYLNFFINPSGQDVASPQSEVIQIPGNTTIHVSINAPSPSPFYYNFDFIYLMMGIGVIALIVLIYFKRGDIHL